MKFSSKLLLSTTVAAAVMSGTLVAGGGGDCPNSKNPRVQVREGYWNGRCADGLNITGLVECASGSSGYDKNDVDFDIFRHIYETLTLGGTLDALTDHTTFIPMDLAFYRLAKELGYTGSYDEQALVNYLGPRVGIPDLGKILRYHVSPDGMYTFTELYDGKRINTLLGGEQIVISEEARKTPICDRRVRLQDTYRLYVHRLDGFPKVQNRLKDIDTSNGLVHVIKAVLVPNSTNITVS